MSDLNDRVLVLMPTAKDSERTMNLLTAAGVACMRCEDLDTLCREIAKGAGAALLTEEVVTVDRKGCLAAVMKNQPPWSDFPLVVLAREGREGHHIREAMNAILVERPVKMRSLLSVVRAALRARRHQYAVRDYLEERRAADRRKDEFMAMLAHELRNPLAPLRNSLQILKLRGTDVGVVEHVRAMMERQVGHLGRLVEDLLDVSRITTGKVQLRKERLDLVRLGRQQVSDHKAAYEAKGVTLQLSAPEVPLLVSGDPTRLAQVLDNLLTNALKFTPAGGEVAVTVAADSLGQATLSVRDTGEGIEPEMLGRLFETFSQADRTLDRNPGGLGLGLAIVKGLVVLHDGSIRAESGGLGQGATLTVTLPAYVESTVPASAPASPPRPNKRMQVLVVEDNRDAADSLRLLLDAYGYEVAVAYSGTDGVRAAEELRPEVVICDIGLPGLDGYGVAEALRGNPATAVVRLIALTGYGRDDDRRRAKAAGFDEHLTKPADPTVVAAILAGNRDGVNSDRAD